MSQSAGFAALNIPASIDYGFQGTEEEKREGENNIFFASFIPSAVERDISR